MYEPDAVLASIDQNMWKVLALCGFAMVCNYTWFIAAVVKGFREQVVPVPIFCILFWLAGDSSMVYRFDTWFNVYDHWYVKLFWLALVFTVMTELVFAYMLLRFGRKEFAPSLTQRQFTLLVVTGIAAAFITWESVKALIGDPLYIDYFHLANLAGPLFAAAQLVRRGHRGGTSPLIWGFYTLMAGSWFVACALWYGASFADWTHLSIYLVCTLSAAAMTVAVSRMPDMPAVARESRSQPGAAAVLA